MAFDVRYEQGMSDTKTVSWLEAKLLRRKRQLSKITRLKRTVWQIYVICSEERPRPACAPANTPATLFLLFLYLVIDILAPQPDLCSTKREWSEYLTLGTVPVDAKSRALVKACITPAHVSRLWNLSPWLYAQMHSTHSKSQGPWKQAKQHYSPTLAKQQSRRRWARFNLFGKAGQKLKSNCVSDTRASSNSGMQDWLYSLHNRHRSHLFLPAARRANPIWCFLGSYTYNDSALLQDYFLITQKLKAEEAETALGGLEAILPLPSETRQTVPPSAFDMIHPPPMLQFNICFLPLVYRQRNSMIQRRAMQKSKS